MRVLMVAAGAAVFALGMAAPATAQTAPRQVAMTPAQTAAHRAACDALAAVVVPDTMIESQNDRLVEALLEQMFKQNENIANLETAYPGMRDAVGAGMKPVLIKYSRHIMPSYRAELSQLYQDKLTTAEARSAAATIAGPAFTHLAQSARANVDFKAVAGALSKDRDVTPAELRRDGVAAGTKSGAEMSAQDRATVIAFTTSPIGLKLRSIAPQKLAIDTKWMNYTTPETEKEMETAVIEAMISHIALTDPETAEQMREELTKPEK